VRAKKEAHMLVEAKKVKDGFFITVAVSGGI